MTQTPGITRKLTTILAADAANFSGRMAADEVGTVQALRRSRIVFEGGITARGGRIANTAGDGLIAEFPSVVEAVAAAVTIQRQLSEEDGLLPFRIGLHLGDVIVEGEDLLGDGVNLAARLQDMAREGGILATRQVVDQAKGRLAAEFLPLGVTRPKHLPEDIPIFAVVAEGVPAPARISDVIPLAEPPRMPLEEKPEGRKTSDKIARYERNRKRGFVVMGGFAALDIVTGSGIGWFIYPVLGIGFFLLLSWVNLSDADKEAIKAARAARKAK